MATTTLRAFLFTDLVGSMDLKRTLGDRGYAEVLSGHDSLFRECLADCGGREVDHAGDGFFAVFSVPSNAVLCALAFQIGMARLDERLSARAGIHIGEVVEARGTEGKLTGLAVDMSARIMGLALGGQVLLSRHAFDSVRQQISTTAHGADVKWLAHGRFLLKGFEDPVEVFEAGVEGVSPLAPPGDSDKARRVGKLGVIGGLRLLEEIGAGAMGTVYLAEVERDEGEIRRGDRVAVKVMHPHRAAEPSLRERFRREVRIGAKVAHANVARVYLAGEAELEGRPTPYLVMEYVPGTDLRELVETLGGMPEGLLREVGAQTADGLAAIHGAGAVHRDLKPDNIRITEDHRVRLIDLGMVLPGDATVDLTAAGSFVGTPLYAAPEQFRAGGVGPAADLYSLGLLLYELAAGRHPIAHREIPGIIQAHLKEEPPPLLDLAPEITPFFAAVVETLLRKRPEERFPSATALASVLMEGEASDWWTARRAATESEGPRLPAIPVPRVTGFHGREEDLGALIDRFEAGREGAHTVLLTGPAGMGKTRLVHEFLTRITAGRDCEILYGAYPPGGAGDALGDAILGRFGEARLTDALRSRMASTPGLADSLAGHLRHTTSAEGVEPLRRDALPAAYCALLGDLSERAPVVFIVEDLHFADEETRAMVLSLVRADPDWSGLLLLTAEPGIGEDELAHLGRIREFERRELPRLDPDAERALLRERLGHDDLCRALAPRIARRCEGVPYFLLETIRTLVQAGSLAESTEGGLAQVGAVKDFEVPNAIRDLILGRAANLSRDDRELLESAAVLGVEFDAGPLAEILETRRIKVLQQLASLERVTGLVRTRGRGHRFDHHQVRQVLYEEIPEALRTEYHSLFAEGREADAAENGEAAWFVARHHLSGSRPDSALPFLDSALGWLELHHRNEAAVDLAERALELPALAESAERLSVLMHLISRLDILGRREEQGRRLTEALALAEESGDTPARSRVLRSRGWFEYCLGKLDASRSHLEAAVEVARTSGSLLEEAHALGLLGNVLASLGSFEDAGDRHRRQLELGEELGDPRVTANAVASLGNLHFMHGRLQEAGEAFDAWLVHARESGDKLEEATATGNLGMLARRSGRTQDAERLFVRWRELAHDTGDLHGEAAAALNLGMLRRDRGDFVAARTELTSGLSASRQIQDGRGEQAALGALGSLERLAGRYPEAQERHEAHLRLARELGDSFMEAVAGVNLGSLLSERGDQERSKRLVEAAAHSFREIEAAAEEGEARLVLGEIAERSGDASGRDAGFHAALDLFTEADDRAGRARTLLALGRTAGEAEKARELIEEARELGEAEDLPEVIVLAAARLSRLPGGDTSGARDVLEKLADRLGLPERYEAALILAPDEAPSVPAPLDERVSAEIRRRTGLTPAG